MRIAICDDVPDDRKAIAASLNEYLESRGMSAEVEAFARPEDLLAAAGHAAFDLYLLDVLLDDKLTGIDLARLLRGEANKVPVIFFSTSREYALDAFSVEAISYLQKPWSHAAFARVMDLATEASRKFQETLLTFRVGTGIVRFAATQIESVETALTTNYVTVYRVGGEPMTIRGSVRSFAEQYRAHVHLVPAGRSLLVNPAQIASLEKTSVRFFSGRTLAIPHSALSVLAKEILALSAP